MSIDAFTTIASWLFGVDVSEFQKNINWAQLFNLGFRFAYVRCAEGAYLDPLHARHTLGARDAGFKTGSYQFGHPTMDANALADFFVAHAFYDQLRPCIDMEALNKDKTVPTNAGAWTLAWCLRVQTKTGARPLVYASTSYMKTMLVQCPALAAYLDLPRDFWDAEYHSDGDFDPIKTPCVARQYEGDVEQAGIAGLADLDVLYSATLAPLEVPAAA